MKMEVKSGPRVVPLAMEAPRPKEEEEGNPVRPVKFMVLLVPVRPLRMGRRFCWRKVEFASNPWPLMPTLKLKGPGMLRLPLKPGKRAWIILRSGKVVFCLLAIDCRSVDRA